MNVVVSNIENMFIHALQDFISIIMISGRIQAKVNGILQLYGVTTTCTSGMNTLKQTTIVNIKKKKKH